MSYCSVFAGKTSLMTFEQDVSCALLISRWLGRITQMWVQECEKYSRDEGKIVRLKVFIAGFDFLSSHTCCNFFENTFHYSKTLFCITAVVIRFKKIPISSFAFVITPDAPTGNLGFLFLVQELEYPLGVTNLLQAKI